MGMDHRGRATGNNHANKPRLPRGADIMNMLDAGIQYEQKRIADSKTVADSGSDDEALEMRRAAARKETADLQRERALRMGQPDPATVDAVGIPEEFYRD